MSADALPVNANLAPWREMLANHLGGGLPGDGRSEGIALGGRRDVGGEG